MNTDGVLEMIGSRTLHNLNTKAMEIILYKLLIREIWWNSLSVWLLNFFRIWTMTEEFTPFANLSLWWKSDIILIAPGFRRSQLLLKEVNEYPSRLGFLFELQDQTKFFSSSLMNSAHKKLLSQVSINFTKRSSDIMIYEWEVELKRFLKWFWTAILTPGTDSIQWPSTIIFSRKLHLSLLLIQLW